MKIAVVGAGISGLVAAYLLDKKYDVTAYEAMDWIGGHAHTLKVQENDQELMLDTGFIVCNKVNYPNFVKLLSTLDVKLRKSEMSFSVTDPVLGFQYNPSTMQTLLAEKRNFINPKFYKLLLDIIKFNKYAKQVAQDPDNPISIGKLVDKLKIGEYCYENYIMPMIASIWSSSVEDALHIPAYFICQFFDNHGLLDINNRIRWYTLENGSQSYIHKITESLKKPVITNAPVQQIVRQNERVMLTVNGEQLPFDKVIIATHSDQALALLANPSQQETSILSGIEYVDNQVTLHTDISVLPKNRDLWAAWNYRHPKIESDKPTITYNLNILQALTCQETYCVSLNQQHNINKDKIIEQFTYAHPKYTEQVLNAHNQFNQISGVENIYYCGAYWGQGFHEDGLNSALAAVKQLDKDVLWETPFSEVR